jgi:hypothetical protein
MGELKPEVERELLDYLKASKEADIGNTLRRLADWTQEHSAEDKVRHAEIMGQLRGHSLRIGELERATEKSGSWQAEAEQARLIEARQHAQALEGRIKFWKDKLIAAGAAILMLVAGTLVGHFFK